MNEYGERLGIMQPVIKLKFSFAKVQLKWMWAQRQKVALPRHMDSHLGTHTQQAKAKAKGCQFQLSRNRSESDRTEQERTMQPHSDTTRERERERKNDNRADILHMQLPFPICAFVCSFLSFFFCIFCRLAFGPVTAASDAVGFCSWHHRELVATRGGVDKTLLPGLRSSSAKTGIIDEYHHVMPCYTCFIYRHDSP